MVPRNTSCTITSCHTCAGRCSAVAADPCAVFIDSAFSVFSIGGSVGHGNGYTIVYLVLAVQTVVQCSIKCRIIPGTRYQGIRYGAVYVECHKKIDPENELWPVSYDTTPGMKIVVAICTQHTTYVPCTST